MRPASRTAVLVRVLGLALVLVTCLGGAVWAVGRLVADPLRAIASAVAHDRVGSLPLEDALAGVCAAVLVAGGVWLAVVSTLVTAEAAVHALRRSAPARLRTWGCPAPLRRLLLGRLLLGCCGVALGTGLAVAPASADPGGPSPAVPEAGVALAGLTNPDRVPGGPVRASGAAAGDHPRPRRVTVSPGDTLWSLAARALPADASDAEITVAWHRLYAANRRTVGPDPDLILPGADLRLPVPLCNPGEERP